MSDESQKRRSEDHNPQERHVIQLTETQLKKLVVDGVHDAMTMIGIDTSDPTEMQKDFQHLREWRTVTTEIQRKGLFTFITIFVTGLCAATWLGVKTLICAPTPPGAG